MYGAGEPTIVLLPGWGLPARSWKGQVHYLASRFRVVALDTRGTGRSSRPRGTAAYRLPEHVADVLAVLDATGTGSAILVGKSRGAQTALALAAGHPGRVRAIAAVGSQVPLTPWPPFDGAWRWFERPERWRRRLIALDVARRGARLLPRLPTLRRFAGRVSLTEGAEMFSRQQMLDDFEAFLGWLLPAVVATDPHSTKQLEDLTGWLRASGPESLADSFMGDCLREPAAARALCARVGCPLLIIHGDRDLTTPFEWGEALAEATGGELRVIRGSGHLPGGRYPVEVNRALRDFAESVATAPAQPTDESAHQTSGLTTTRGGRR